MKLKITKLTRLTVLAAFITASTLIFSASRVAAVSRPDIVIADFESADYGNWKTEGGAFGDGPAQGKLPGQQVVQGFKGKGLVNSFHGNDGGTGTLTSPEFKIERKFVAFLIGGGGYTNETFMELLVDGKAVRTATGPNTKPGGGETLAPHIWDVSGLQGKSAVIRIVDRRTGGWGHINVDNIIQTDDASLSSAVTKPAATDSQGGETNDPNAIVIADFEGADYGDWKIAGTAFGDGPALGTLPGQHEVSGFKGKGLVNSFYNGDGTTGKLTSPEFKIERSFINFLIGGGGFSNRTCMNLLIGGKCVRTATGPNTEPGGSEALVTASWEVREFKGQTAVIEIVDAATGSWGHINVDQIMQSDIAAKVAPKLVTLEHALALDKHYLLLPVKTGNVKDSKPHAAVLVDGAVVREFDIELSDQPDWFAHLDVSAWQGKPATLRVTKMVEDSKSLGLVAASDTIWHAAELYHEPLRGQLHFSPARGWNNDPNGMVFYRGEYHLFFQHNPFGWNWGNMHWGHAVSKDMVHWQELGDVLAPDKLGAMFSGSAVVDWKNTSGLGKDGQPPLVLIYTAAGSPTVQCLASSVDGRNFTKFSGNPVVKQITAGNRDPKVLWHEPTKEWVMALYVGLPTEGMDENGKPLKIHTIHFLISTNLTEWTVTSQIEGFHECPDIFELPVDGNAQNKKWVLTAANSDYMIGTFDGQTFAPETPKLTGQVGRGYYAAQIFSDEPQGRVVQMGWLRTETRGMAFNQSMSLPNELKLLTTPEGPRLAWIPTKEAQSVRGKFHNFGAVTIRQDSENPLVNVNAELVELRAEFEPSEASVVAFTVRGAKIIYDAKKQEIAVNGIHAPAPLRDGKQKLIIYCDRTALEVFASDGLAYVPLPFQPPTADRSLDIKVTGGSMKFADLQVHELKSIWE